MLGFNVDTGNEVVVVGVVVVVRVAAEDGDCHGGLTSELATSSDTCGLSRSRMPGKVHGVVKMIMTLMKNKIKRDKN